MHIMFPEYGKTYSNEWYKAKKRYLDDYIESCGWTIDLNANRYLCAKCSNKEKKIMTCDNQEIVYNIKTSTSKVSVVTTLEKTFTVRTIEEANTISKNLIHIASKLEELFGVDCEVSAPISAEINGATICCRLDITN